MIKGKRLTIRPIDINDIDILYEWWTSSEVMSHAGFKYGLPISYESHKDNLLSEIKDINLYRTRRRFIIESDKPIGEINYSNWDMVSRKCSIGIKLCDFSTHGNGFGYEALTMFIKFLFDTLNIRKVTLDTTGKNKIAQKLYEKCGFRKVGISKKDFFDSSTDTYQDVVLYEIFKKDFFDNNSHL